MRTTQLADSLARIKQKSYKFFIRSLVTILALEGAIGAQLLMVPTAHAATRDVVINEVQWMGSSVGADDEWIELYNTTGSDIDLTGWTITNVDIGGDIVIASGTIVAGGFFLISHYNVGASSALTIAPNAVVPTINIADSCVPIDLIPAGEITPMDSMGCDTTNYFGGVSVAKKALERTQVIADGLASTSWQTSVGFANLDATVFGATTATPGYANDATAASAVTAVINDGTATDIQFTSDGANASGNWSGFADADTPVTAYSVGLGTTATTDDVVAFPANPFTTPFTATTKTFTGLALTENQTYFVLVRPINGAGIVGSIAASNGMTFNTTDPDLPTGLTVADTPNDNGGSITVSWSAPNIATSPDVTGYDVSYQKVGNPVETIVHVNGVTAAAITGLENTPSTYAIKVRSVDFEGRTSSYATAGTSAQAIDNLAPIIDTTKVVMSQNHPGSNDAVSGLAGASNEGGATIRVFDHEPSSVLARVINSVTTNSDGSFAALSLGDNLYGQVWLQLTDTGGNVSVAKSFSNDIVAPSPPLLTKLNARCLTRCQVTVDWQSPGADATHYQVAYAAAVDPRTGDIMATGVGLDLPSGSRYTFTVYAYDAAGNVSAASNVLAVRLTAGVETSVELINGKAVTTTKAVPGARSTISSSAGSNGSTLIPKAQAAEPTITATATAEPSIDDAASGQDWLRIFIVVVLLLIVAGSFYALSRSFGAEKEEQGGTIKPRASEARTTAAAQPTKRRTSTAKKPNRKRPRRRR